MKRKCRKLLSLLTALCLVFSMTPLAALAAETDPSGYWTEYAAETYGQVVNETAKTVTISSEEELALFAKQVNEGTSYAGYTISITKDLDMSAHYWNPIDTATLNGDTGVKEPKKKLDNAVIQGNGYTITGIITNTGIRGPGSESNPGDGQYCYYYSGFIGRNDGVLTIENLTFKDADIKITEPAEGVAEHGSSSLAVIAGYSNGALTLENVNIDSCKVSGEQKVGGFIGQGASPLTVEKCSITNSIFEADYFAAPINAYAIDSQYSTGTNKSNIQTINGIKLENNQSYCKEESGVNYKELFGASYADWAKNSGVDWYLMSCDTLHLNFPASVPLTASDGTQYCGIPLALVAEVGGYSYPSLREALEAAEDGDTVTLIDDETFTATEDKVYYALTGKSITLDLNGKTFTEDLSQLTTNTQHTGVIVIGANAGLTIQDTSSNGDGKIVQKAPTGSYSTAAMIENWGTFTLESGTIQAEENIYYCVSMYGESSNTTINGGVIDAQWGDYADGGVALGSNGTKESAGVKYEGYKLTINGGAVKGGEQTLYLASAGTTEINGGTLEGSARAIEIRAGDLTINDGTLKADAARINGAVAQNGGTGKYTGTIVVVKPKGVSANGYNGNIDVQITGGTFLNGAEQGDVVTVSHEGPSSISQDVSVSATNGYFTGNWNVGDSVNSTGQTYGTDTLSLSGGYYTSDVNEYAAVGYETARGSWSENTYTYKVVKAEPDKITSVKVESVKDDTQTATKEDVSASLSGNTISVVGMVADTSVITVNYVTAKTTEQGQFTVIFKDGAFQTNNLPSPFKIGETTYVVDLSGLTLRQQVAVVPPAIDAKAELKGTPTEQEKSAAVAVAEKAANTEAKGISAAASQLVQPTEDNQGTVKGVSQVQIDKATSELNAAEGETVILAVQPYLDIKVTSVSLGENDETKELTLDIEPKYNVVVTTDPDDIQTETGNKNAVVLEGQEGKPLTVTNDVTITVPIPDDIVKIVANEIVQDIFIKHVKGNGDTYHYKATVGGSAGSYTAEFTVTHGFSSFTVLSDGRSGIIDFDDAQIVKPYNRENLGEALPVASKAGFIFSRWKIGEKVYTTLTNELLGVINGKTIIAEAVFTTNGGGGGGGEEPEEWVNPFKDVKEKDWFYDAVKYTNQKKLFGGTAADKFSPEDTMTRGMLVTVLHRLEGEPAVDTVADFSDVKATEYYAKPVNWAAANKIVGGFDGKFNPEDPVTREEMAAILHRYAAYKAYDVSATATLDSFRDGGKTSSWAVGDMKWAVGAGMIYGRENNTLAPGGTATRAEVAQIMMRFCEKFITE